VAPPSSPLLDAGGSHANTLDIADTQASLRAVRDDHRPFQVVTLSTPSLEGARAPCHKAAASHLYGNCLADVPLNDVGLY
jgi:hypothetical protein